MAEFSVEVYHLKVEPHGNADTLDLGVIGDYKSVIRKGQFQDGQLVAYIPEAAIIPDDLLAELGLTGKLSGSAKNRVKAIKLRGVLSQGIVYAAREGWVEGQNVMEELKITKYEPPIPSQFAGEQGSLKPRVLNGETQAQGTLTLKFDIENIKKWNRIFEEGEEVVMTEKTHGSFCCIGVVPEEYRSPDLLQGMYAVSSKGLIRNGVFIKDNEVNKNNTYLRAATKFQLGNWTSQIRDLLETKETVWLLGEVYGLSVQGGYGYGVDRGDVGFRAFDIKVGDHYLDYVPFKDLCDMHNIETVPLLYRGPFSRDALALATNGKETLSGNEAHIREGTVVKPVLERVDRRLGRVILKSVSDAYLAKSDGEEIQ